MYKAQESTASATDYSRKMQKCAERGYRDYMIEILDLYEEHTATQSMVFFA